jgi:hypothetical protein
MDLIQSVIVVEDGRRSPVVVYNKSGGTRARVTPAGICNQTALSVAVRAIIDTETLIPVDITLENSHGIGAGFSSSHIDHALRRMDHVVANLIAPALAR